MILITFFYDVTVTIEPKYKDKITLENGKDNKKENPGDILYVRA
jgi:hypothetical protein